MLLAFSVIALLGQTADAAPAGLSSPDPTGRVVAVRMLLKQPPNEVRGAWLFDAMLDPDPKVATEAVRGWPKYSLTFNDELGAAIAEAQLDGASLTNPATSMEEWQKKLAARLTTLAKSNQTQVADEALRALVRLSSRPDIFAEDFLLTYEIDNGEREREGVFTTALKSIVASQPGRAITFLRTVTPGDAVGLIIALKSDMPVEVDQVYSRLLQRTDATWQRVGIAGIFYRPRAARLKALFPLLANQNRQVSQDAAECLHLSYDDWTELLAKRENWPVLAKALGVRCQVTGSWPKGFAEYMFNDPDPLIQAASMSQIYALPINHPDKIDIVKKRFRSNVPELRESCLQALVSCGGETYRQCLTEAFQDKSEMVREAAFRYADLDSYFDRQKVEAFASGIGEAYEVSVRFGSPENAQLLAECVVSTNERKRLLAAGYYVENQPDVAVPMLQRLARSKDVEVRVEALMGLMACGKQGAVAMVDLLDPSDEGLFRQTLNMIQSDFDYLAKPKLKKFLTHPNRKIRIYAKQALRPPN